MRALTTTGRLEGVDDDEVAADGDEAAASGNNVEIQEAPHAGMDHRMAMGSCL